MKIFLGLLLMVSFSARAGTLETFFSSLEGKWKSTAADSYRETTDGEIAHSIGTKFESTVVRTGNRWAFTEEACWQEESGENTCGNSALTYVVNGNELSMEMDGKSFAVDVLESDDDYLVITFSTDEFVFTAVVEREGDSLTQNAELEMNDGTKVYELFELVKFSP